VDYSHPFNLQSKLEAGAKYVDRGTDNEFTAMYQDATSGAFRGRSGPQQQFLVPGAHRQRLRACVPGGRQAAGTGGIRLEEARTQFDLPLTSHHFDKHYASTYRAPSSATACPTRGPSRVSYSRRVSRPSPFQLNPIEVRQDSRNVTRGNPTLGAEYIDALELGFQEARAWGSLQLNPFIKHASHGIRELQFVDTNGVSVKYVRKSQQRIPARTDVTVGYRRGPLTSSLGGSISYNRTDASNLTGYSLRRIPPSAPLWWNVPRQRHPGKFSNLADAQLFASFRPPPRKTESSTTLAQVGAEHGRSEIQALWRPGQRCR